MWRVRESMLVHLCMPAHMALHWHARPCAEIHVPAPPPPYAHTQLRSGYMPTPQRVPLPYRHSSAGQLLRGQSTR